MSEGGFSGVFHPHAPGVIVDNANQISDIAKGELKTWLEPWFQTRNTDSGTVIASISAVISAPQAIPPGAAFVNYDTIELHEDTAGAFTLASGGINCTFAGEYMFSAFMAMQGGATNLVAMLRRGGQEFGRSYMPGGFGNISVTGGVSVNAGDRITGLIYQDAASNLPLNSSRIVGFRL